MYATVIATIYDSRAIDSEEGKSAVAFGECELICFFRVYGCNADFKLRGRASDLITERKREKERRVTIPVAKNRSRIKLQCYNSHVRRFEVAVNVANKCDNGRYNKVDTTSVYRLTVIYAKRNA